ncbi:MAG: hypothetical protein ACLFS4_03605 [Opitutales bacterium]
MKKNHPLKLRVVTLFVAGAIGFVPVLAPQALDAQSQNEEQSEETQKIRLMAEALRARDAGDFDRAKEKAEELLKVAPDDENAEGLLASIEKAEEQGSDFGEAEEGAPEEMMEQAPVQEEGSEAGEESSEADQLVATAASEQKEQIAAANKAIERAGKLAELGAYNDALSSLEAAQSDLTLNMNTARVLERIEDTKAEVVYAEAKALAEGGEFEQAEERLTEYVATGGDGDKARALGDRIDNEVSDPQQYAIEELSPEFTRQSRLVRELIARGRAQFLNGDYEGAAATFKEAEARAPNNREAKLYSTRIAEIIGEIHGQNVDKTRQQMLTEVDQQWERPKVFDVDTTTDVGDDAAPSIQRKIENIVIPEVNFSGMELTRVIETLSELAREYDSAEEGVNIIPMFDADETNPRVNITLRDLSLDRILQFVTQQVDFNYDVGSDAVTVAPSDALEGSASTVTEFFPISRGTVVRLTGVGDGDGGGGGDSGDPFAPRSDDDGGGGRDDATEDLKEFFQQAGVNFDQEGASLAFDGEQLIVTQSRRNIERMRNILRNYTDIRQVEIEAKFLEVSQTDLEEFGVDWGVQDGGREFTTGNNRTLNDAFSTATEQSQIVVSRPIQEPVFDDDNAIIGTKPVLDDDGNVMGDKDTFPLTPPDLATAIDLASTAGDVFTASGWTINGADIDVALRALSRKRGSDLMSAPKVTVLSGKRARISVAQELRYPESYGDIESTASGGGDDDGGGDSSISITAGTPQDFVSRNVGVEMSVTPSVANDDTISLVLEPRVTEFEGFVEYGGPSIAVSGGTTVSVPSGFFQPIFSTREIETEVTVFDGATVVMGGLTRDEVKTVDDSVPVLSDIPGIGRLFRSEGETREKRNLLIFVTANLVSPGGSPAKQSYESIEANSLFQNPTIMTPSGTSNRDVQEAETPQQR